MSTSTRIAAFAAGLLVVFAAAIGVGALVGPVGGVAASPSTNAPADPGHGGGSADPGHGGAPVDPAPPAGEAVPAVEPPGGLMVSQDGYTLDLEDREQPLGAARTLRFRILGPDGRPVTRYTTEHDKRLHLIAVRRDLVRFQHVHPTMAADGTWSVPLDLSDAGVHRVFADFTPAGRETALTLGADLFVPGRYRPESLPPADRTATVDGYTVTLDGTLEPGGESELRLQVSRAGVPVTDLQPYLGAYGHLVALRDADLAYLHVHPAGQPDDGRTRPGPDITFYATAPSAGTYRLFLDFRHDGEVRTAAFTVAAGEQRTGAGPDKATPSPTRPAASSQPSHGEDHGHGG